MRSKKWLYFNTFLIRKFIAVLAYKGYLFRSLKLVSSVFMAIKVKGYHDTQKYLYVLLEKLRPIVILRKKVIAGVDCKIPALVSVPRAESFVFRWFYRAVYKGNFEKNIFNILLEELVTCFSSETSFVKQQIVTLQNDIIENIHLLRFIKRRRRRRRFFL